MAIHRLSVAAFQQAGDPTCYPDQLAAGLRPYAPQKLYFTAYARSAMCTMRETLLEAGGTDSRPGGNAATIPLEEMGTADELITTAITLDGWQLDAKLRAMRAHRTQMGPRNPINRLSPDATRAWLGTERLVRAYPPGARCDGGGAAGDVVRLRLPVTDGFVAVVVGLLVTQAVAL
jgi:LmbE family N-acetylglucosaminyl deacetylase